MKEINKEKDCKCSGNSIVRSKGEQPIVIVRQSFNILQDLPYPIFGTTYLQAQNFAVAVKDYLPDGVTCSSIVEGQTISLTYTQGALNDTITIFTPPDALISYPELLTGLNTNFWKTELVYFCNNTQIPNLPILTNRQNKKLQAAPLYMQKVGGLNDKSNELIIPLSRRLPNNSVNNIVEISMRNQDIMPHTVWIHKFAYINMTEKRALVFYWNIIINELVNMNKTAFKLS